MVINVEQKKIHFDLRFIITYMYNIYVAHCTCILTEEISDSCSTNSNKHFIKL